MEGLATKEVVRMVAEAYSGEAPVEAEPIKSFSDAFDSEFQTKIAALAIRDTVFMKSVVGLLKPQFFDNLMEATYVSLVLEYFAKYQKTPDKTAFVMLVSDAIASKIIRKDMTAEVKPSIKLIYAEDILDREFVIDKVESFARHQAVSNAILESVGYHSKGQFDKVWTAMKSAIETGANREAEVYDYFERIDERTQERRDLASGAAKPTGITTGIIALDNLLMHKGWGRRELTSILGGAKVGKTTALINFAKSAAFAGHNVIYFTLEVAPKIISARLDAAISNTIMSELESKFNHVAERVKDVSDRHGKLVIREYPTGSMTPGDVRRTLDLHISQGVTYDLVVVDYADIMSPDFRNQDVIENSKNIYQGLRAISQEYDCAVLTATQTNREGFKSTVAKAEHTSEDFNKVRIVDLLISINKTEDEADRNEARLYFAASRNQKGGFTVRIQQDLEKMIFVTKVLGLE